MAQNPSADRPISPGSTNVKANNQVNAKANNKVNANGHRHFEDFGDVDPEEVVPLSLTIIPLCIHAYAAGLTSDCSGIRSAQSSGSFALTKASRTGPAHLAYSGTRVVPSRLLH